jgi:hypothetical protein
MFVARLVPTALALSLASLMPAAAEQFQFNPPDGATFVVSVRTTRTTTLGALGKRTEDRETSERVRVTKTADGFSIAETAVYGTMNRDGEKVESPILKLLVGMSVNYEVDSRGQVKAIRGFDQLITRLKAALPPGTLETMSPTVTEEALVNREVAEWNGRVASFVGREVKVGDMWTSKDRFDLPTGGAVNFTTTTRIVGREQVEGHDCVRLKFSYTANAPTPLVPGQTAGAKAAGKPARKPSRPARVAKKTVPAAATSITGGGDRLVDPATMLIYAESISRTIKMPVAVPGRGKVAGTLVERKSYRYQYE